MNDGDPIRLSRLLVGGAVIVGLAFALAHFFFGANAFTGGAYPFTLLFVAVCACGGFRFLATSRLSKPFGIGVKAVGIGLVLLAAGGVFNTVHISGVTVILASVFGMFLLILGDDIMERPALPQASRTVFGDARNAGDWELDQALRSKSGNAEPMFKD